MREVINKEVGVVMYFSAKQKLALPRLVSWQGRDYPVGEVGYHHTVWAGKTLHHIYELVDKGGAVWMRLNFNTSNLHWTLEAVSDGLAD
jgi:hypothetical protein